MNTTVDTKKQILDIAENLLLDRGYNGFSYQHISSALGIRNASVHHHYPQKTDLGVAIIRRTRERFERWTKSRNADSSFAERLAQFVSLFRYFLKNGGQVCLGGALETDFKTLPPEMQTETREFIAAIWKWLTRFLQEGRSRGEFTFPGEPDKQAIVIMSCLQGALQISRATDPSCFEAAAEQISRLICP